MWQLKGIDYLEDLSGQYEEEELFAILVLALEKSKSIFDFDLYIEGRDERGARLSGSQLLSRFSEGP